MRKESLIKIYIIILNIVIISRLFFIMIINDKYYKKLYNESNNTYIESFSAPRGRIIDKLGNILVDNKGINVVIFNNIDGIDKKERLDIAKKLASVININTDNVSIKIIKKYIYDSKREEIDKKVSNNIIELYKNRKITSDSFINYKYNLITLEEINNTNKKEALIYSIISDGYIYQDKIIKKDITDEELTKINELNLSGIRIDTLWERIYNYDTCLNQLFGSIGPIEKEKKDKYLNNGYKLNDIVGNNFLEEYYEDTLKGEKALYKIEDNNTLKETKSIKRGNDLVLSIDIEKQLEIEKYVKEEIINAKKVPSSKYYNGSYIVISDPTNGSIVSLVAIKYEDKTFKSDVVGLLTNSYTVGSVVKGASQSVAYKYGVIDKNKKILDSCVKLYSKPEKCSWKRLGYLNDIDAITYSSNYYQFINAIKVSGYTYTPNMRFEPGESAFIKYRSIFKSYGLGDYTKIDLNEEKLGITGNNYSGDLLLNLSIGQYDTYTPLMLNNYISTIANGKYRYKLRLVDYGIDEYGNIIDINPKEALNELKITDEDIKRIQTSLRNVVLKGTAHGYISDEYKAAGKTGTSETFYNGISTTTKSFISYFPFDNPEYSMVIISPNIGYSSSPNNYKYPINSKLSRKITNILFEK